MTARRSVWTSVDSVRACYTAMRFLIASPFSILRFRAEISRFLAARSPRAAASILLLFAILWTVLAATSEVRAQQSEPGIVAHGDLVVSGFSGKAVPPADPPLPAGTSELDETLIDVGGASLKVFDISSPGGPSQAQLIDAPVKFQVPAGEIGQVFGLAIDNASPHNIYATATPVHGLQIVLPDGDGDGRPERLKLGQPGAQWMDGQFGASKGGGPGSVWKIDGATGAVTLFANIGSAGAPGSGSGLGNIAFDDEHKQFYVSDLGTGLIHRLDMSGADLGTFDHGVRGRPANGLDAIADDPANKLDITSPAFDSEDPESWGFTDPRRRVWGLAYHRGRLYYAVADGPQIWSLGIAEDGNFAGDPRWELDVAAGPKRYPVSDIAFARGQMILAQRGGIASRYDYSRFHSPRNSKLLRYRLEAPDDPGTPSRWVAEPDEYANGFPATHRNTSGGVAVGYGYKKSSDGSYQFGSCSGTLWSTGDALRDNPVHQDRLAQGGPFTVHGVQGNAFSAVRPENEPPWASYFVDYDGQFDDPEASGHVGDVEIAQQCERKRSEVMDLRILKRAVPELCTVGNQCDFEIEIANTGTKTYSGALVIQDIAHGGAQLIGHGPPDWNCREAFPGSGVYECAHPPVTLKPGEKTSLQMTFQMPPWWVRPVYSNCVELRLPGAGVDERPYNNRSCDYVATVEPGHEFYAPDLQLEKFGLFGACDFFGLCEFVVRVTNVGAAPYTGQLHVNDIATTAGATLVDWSPKPDWNCAALGPDSYGCSTAAPVTLLPGDFREIIILVQGPAIAPGVTHVHNCANIDWNGAPGDPNPHNEFDCAELSNLPPGHPDARPKVQIQKDANPTCSRVAAGNPWTCVYAVRISNSGTAPLDGPIAFTDTVTAHPATLLGFLGGPGAWACAPGVGFAGPYTCTHPPIAGGLLPGSEVVILMGFELPAATPVPSVEVNTATIQWDNDGDGVDEDHTAVAISLICDAGAANCQKDLAVLKTPPGGACLKGDACPFTVQVQNLANVNFPGPVTVTDIPDPGTGAPNVLTPGWGCVPAGGSFTCTHPAGIPSGGFASFSLEFPVPAGYASPTLENCAEVAPGPDNVFPFNDKDCAIAVVPHPDLAPWSPSSCTRGTDCPLEVQVDNKGQLPFVGSAGLRGTLAPGVKIKSISSSTPGFSCKVTGNGRYECSGGELNIAPGDAARLQFVAVIPADFPHDAITHTKTMVWPDRKVKDLNPTNDQHVSTIDILGPKESPKPPPPPPPPAGEPDLAVVKTANQAACRAGDSGCGFTVTVTNAGTAPYSGPIDIADTISPSTATLVSSGPPPWRCQGRGGEFGCFHPPTTLQPGQSKILSLTFRLPGRVTGAINNCVLLRWGGAPQTRASVRDVQGALAARGFNPGPVDGKAGRKTVDAVRAYQSQNGLPVTGRIDQALLASLFAQPGGGDPNPANDRACVVSSIIGQPPPPPPPPCTGGQFRNNYGACVCPANEPVWTGTRCIPRPPQPCTGGRYRDNKGVCVCPANEPVWTGNTCIARPPAGCSGGRIRNDRGQCVCPASKPTWTGQICIPKITICSGGRVFSLKQRKCVCPSNKPYWTGKSCSPYTTNPGLPKPEITPGCSGGRIKTRSGQCVCPSSKPVWTGQVCIPAKIQINPNLQKLIPQLQIR